MPSKSPRSNGFALAIVIEGGLGIVGVVVAGLFGVPLNDYLPDSAPAWGNAIARGTLAALLMLAIFWWVARSSRPTIRRLREQVEWIVSEMFPAATLGQLALVAALAGVSEELLFRGVLQTLVAWLMGPIPSLIVCSLLFGVFHALSKAYFLFATLVGFGLGWLFYEYNDLVAPMLAHGLYDFLALAYIARTARPSEARL